MISRPPPSPFFWAPKRGEFITKNKNAALNASHRIFFAVWKFAPKRKKKNNTERYILVANLFIFKTLLPNSLLYFSCFGPLRFGLFARTLRTKRLALVFFCVVAVVHHRVAVFLVFVFLGFVVAVAEISNFVAAHLNIHLGFLQWYLHWLNNIIKL